MNPLVARQLYVALEGTVNLASQGMPEGLAISKGPGLVLNALLAREVFVEMFKFPFFWVPTIDKKINHLEETYVSILNCKLSMSSKSPFTKLL